MLHGVDGECENRGVHAVTVVRDADEFMPPATMRYRYCGRGVDGAPDQPL